MHIVLIANGLANRGEHSYRLIQEVRSALARRGIGVSAFASKSLDPAIMEEGVAVPHFKHSLYDSVGPLLPNQWVQSLQKLWSGAEGVLNYPAEFLTWRVLNRSFQHDLEALPPELCTPDDLLVITAANQNQIDGVVEFMRGRPQESLPKVICQLMFPPTWTVWARTARHGEAYYRQAFQKASRFIGKKLFFTTENAGIAKIYRERFGLETTTLPIPFALMQQPRQAGKTIRLGFFGYSKSAKGFHLLPEVAALCKNAGLDVEFLIQIQHSGWEQSTNDAERKLRTLPNVQLIEGVLNSEDYIRQTNTVDVVLLPYDPVLFGMGGSGIFTESVAAGRPIVASEGTFAAECIAKGEAQGEVFAPYTASEFAAAISRLLPRMPECRTRAAACAEAFARRHSGEAYVDALLGHVDK
jgi:glycosyltransferase involved in cell wall biosynthesis